MTGTVFKRCPCSPVVDAAGRRKNCPKRHGSWFFVHDVHDPSGKRRQVRRVRRIHPTLRSALNDAVRRVVPYNPAALAELEPTRRLKVRPWEPEELGAFLDFADGHRLGVLFEVLAMTGLRRGEVVGLRWGDVDLDKRVLWVRQSVVQVGHGSVVGQPKTASRADRRVDLDAATAGSLIAHRLGRTRKRLRSTRRTRATTWSSHARTAPTSSPRSSPRVV